MLGEEEQQTADALPMAVRKHGERIDEEVVGRRPK
jgi:hypothetical protein